MSERWLTGEAAAALIRQRLACSAGRADAFLQQAKELGDIRARTGLYLIEDGVLDFDTRPPVRCLATASGAELSEEDFLDWLDRTHPAAQLKGKGGRPRKFSSAAVADEVWLLMDHHGEFCADDPDWNAQARLVEAIRAKFGEASDSTLEDYIKEPLAAWRKAKAPSPET